MELNISKNLKQSGSRLDYWQLLYCANFNAKPKQLEEHLDKKLAELYALAEQDHYFTIDASDNSYLERHFQGEMAALRSRGEGQNADYSEQNKKHTLGQMARYFSGIHKSEYSHLTEWFQETGCQKEIIALLLQETLSKVYGKDTVDGEEKTYVRKREQGKTIASHMALNAMTVPEIITGTQGALKFADVYFKALEILKEQCQGGSGVVLEGVNTFGMGNWLKFDSQYANPQGYHANVQKLQALVANTPWCTKYLAGSQLSQGDFYVFVDNGDEEKCFAPQPHIAVRLSGATIGEVRGILPGQEIESEYLQVAEDFLVNNKSISGGRTWLEDTALNRRYVAYNQAILDGTFRTEQIEDMLEDLGKTTRINSNRVALRSNLPLLKPLLSSYFKVPEDHINLDEMQKYPRKWIRSFDALHAVKAEHEKVTGGHFASRHVWPLVKTLGYAVSLGDCNSTLMEARQKLMLSLPDVKKKIADYFKVPAREVYFGNLDLADRQTYGVYIVFGDVTDSRNSRTQGDQSKYIEHFASHRHPAKTVKYIVGNVNIEYGLTKTFPQLLFCFGDFKVKGDNFQGAPHLKEVHGYLALNTTRVNNLSALKTAREGVFVKSSFIRNLGSLQTVEGPVELERSQINNLHNLITLPASLSIINTRMPHNLKLREVGGDITVKGYLDAPNLRQARKITSSGSLQISPDLKADVIVFNYREFSVAKYLVFRRKRLRNHDAGAPEHLTFAGMLAEKLSALAARFKGAMTGKSG